jgi:predicted nucleic acid-binding protein
LPSSKLPERLAVDATAIIAAIIGGKARRVFFELPIIEFATTDYTVGEARFHIDNLVARHGQDRMRLEQNLQVLPLRVYGPDTYGARLDDARRRIRDQNDIDLFALALTLTYPVWTQDDDFHATGIDCYRTGILLRWLDRP